MLEGDVVLNPSQKDWDCIEGYTSCGAVCPICKYDILVKTGTTVNKTLGASVLWYLCHVCFDKGWKIPTWPPNQRNLIYHNSKTGETKEIEIDYGF